MKTKFYYALLVVLVSFILTSKSYAHETTQFHTHNEQLTAENKKTAPYSKQIIDTTYALIFIYLSFWIASKSFKKETSK
jgi:hypothetical protein